MTHRRAPTALEIAVANARTREASARLPAVPKYGMRARGGIEVRILKCDICDAVWPTERDEAHGGSRLDGEPCAYRWPDGRVCMGHVRPLGYVPPQGWDAEEAPRRSRAVGAWAEGDGRWRKVLGVDASCRSLAAVRKAYRARAVKVHPDAGGSHAEMVALNEAYADALAELGQP